MREAQMAWGVSSKLWHPSTLCKPLHDLGPHDERKGTGKVAMGLREKQRARYGTEQAALWEVRFKKPAGDDAVAHHPFRSILGMLGTNMDLSVGNVEIADRERYQFL